jgi:ribulose 1,5-bisphosphate synthetase/thiazole synthase
MEIKISGGGMGGGGTTFDKIEINKPVDPKLYKPE